jgi:hypothetical protein
MSGVSWQLVVLGRVRLSFFSYLKMIIIRLFRHRSRGLAAGYSSRYHPLYYFLCDHCGICVESRNLTDDSVLVSQRLQGVTYHFGLVILPYREYRPPSRLRGFGIFHEGSLPQSQVNPYRSDTRNCRRLAAGGRHLGRHRVYIGTLVSSLLFPPRSSSGWC